MNPIDRIPLALITKGRSDKCEKNTVLIKIMRKRRRRKKKKVMMMEMK